MIFVNLIQVIAKYFPQEGLPRVIGTYPDNLISL
jgi:hypothetical protein